MAFALCPCPPLWAQPPSVSGVMWQPHNGNIRPEGTWHQLGATTLLVQWSAVDGRAFVPRLKPPVDGTTTLPLQQPADDASMPDWQRIGQAPWAQTVIMGLPGYFQEAQARTQATQLARSGRAWAIAPAGVNVVGWYFPVEFDPTWDVPTDLIEAMADLPRPLWISVYDSANVGPGALIQHIMRWLPSDAGLFFQDGVGVHARDARTAQHYAQALTEHFGKNRVRVIAEAFRPDAGGGFRAATPAELGDQLRAYAGYAVYLFEGPTYVPPATVSALLTPDIPTVRNPQGLAE